MTEQPTRTPADELEHWRSELARVLKAAPDLHWTNLIEWAEEAEHFALKACTRSGRKRLAELEQTAEAAEAEVKRLNGQLDQARKAKLAQAQPRLAAMEKLAAAWQKEAERARNDLARQAHPDDGTEFIIWSALEGPLDEYDVTSLLQTLRHCRYLATEAMHVFIDDWKAAKKRITDLHTPVQHLGKTWCSECSVQRRTGPHTNEWVAFIPHPCPTLEALENKEPTT
jgi:hypothetical protein